jgi:hypothetical protein
MRLRHLLWRSVPVICPPCSVEVTNKSIKCDLIEMLRVAKMVPNAGHASEHEACSWLFKSPSLETFVKAASFALKPSKENDMKLYFASLFSFSL